MTPNPDANQVTKHKAELTGVSETALLTLNARAQEARRSDRVLDDPVAVALADSIDYDFSRFGRARQDMALRARAYDLAAQAYLDNHPEATVVALAEGLQTSFWRLDAAIPDAKFRWLTVDLAPIIEIRKQLLPENPRVELCAQSALDYSWMDRIKPDAGSDKGVFITAEGLLMYLQPEQSLALIAECAKHFRGGQMVFDLPPAWFTAVARSGWLRPSRHYTVPTMPFSMSVGEAARLVDTIPGVRAVHDLPMPAARGKLLNAVLQTGHRTPLLHRLRGVFTLLEFG